jgi:hypothetical protein
VARTAYARVNEIIDQVAALYARNFTAAELNEVVAFYRGPTGQKFIQKLDRRRAPLPHRR